MTSYREMLDQCYKKALEQDDTNLAVEIADKLKGLAPIDVPDERIQKFIEALDEMIACYEVIGKRKDTPYSFEYGGQNFEVKII